MVDLAIVYIITVKPEVISVIAYVSSQLVIQSYQQDYVGSPIFWSLLVYMSRCQ